VNAGQRRDTFNAVILGTATLAKVVRPTIALPPLDVLSMAGPVARLTNNAQAATLSHTSLTGTAASKNIAINALTLAALRCGLPTFRS
jgi:hypothetical protein